MLIRPMLGPPVAVAALTLLAPAGSAAAGPAAPVPVAAVPVAAVPAAGGPAAAGSVRAPKPTIVPYAAPLPALDVVRGFDRPRTPYGPGHLGVDLRAGPAVVVRAAAGGVVRFAGAVAGRGVVVIAHPDGVSTEYEPLRPLVVTGRDVRAGQPIGIVVGRHRGCPGWCLHWGARRGAVYLDPLALLRPLGPVRLLPWTPADVP